MKKSFALSAITASILLLGVGCGGGSSSSSDNGDSNVNTPESIKTKTGYYVDSAVVGVNYECKSSVDGQEVVITGVTDENGSFEFQDGQTCTFSIAGVTLREINTSTLPDNGIVVENNLDVARFLQTLDNDNNPDNGIVIESNVSETLKSLNVLPDGSIPATDEDLANLATQLQEKVPTYHGEMVTEEEAKAHLEETIAVVRDMNGVMEVHRGSDDNESYNGETITNREEFTHRGEDSNRSGIETGESINEVNSTMQNERDRELNHFEDETNSTLNGINERNISRVGDDRETEFVNGAGDIIHREDNSSSANGNMDSRANAFVDRESGITGSGSTSANSDNNADNRENDDSTLSNRNPNAPAYGENNATQQQNTTQTDDNSEEDSATVDESSDASVENDESSTSSVITNNTHGANRGSNSFNR